MKKLLLSILLVISGIIYGQINPPTNLTADLNDETGEVELNWQMGTGDGFYEDFEDGLADNWEPVTGDWEISGGNYNCSNDIYRVCSSYYDNEFSNYVYEVKLRQTSGTFYSGVGLFFNGDPTSINEYGNWNNGYGLRYRADGQWALYVFVSGELSFIRSWGYSSSLNQGINSWNTIQLFYSNGFIDICFNNGYQYTYYDDSITSGFVGLGLSDNNSSGSAEYEYATLTSLPIDYQFREVRQTESKKTYSFDKGSYPDNSYLRNNVDRISALRSIFNTQNNYYSNTENREFQFFIIYRNGLIVAATTDTLYTEILPDFGTYEYEVTALYDEGQSIPAGPVTVEWLCLPEIDVSATSINETIQIGETSTQYLTISNNGDCDLTVNIAVFNDITLIETNELENRYQFTESDIGKFIDEIEITSDNLNVMNTKKTITPRSMGDVIHQIFIPYQISTSAGLTFDGAYLWLVEEPEGMAYQLNPTDGTIVSSIQLPSYGIPCSDAYGIAWDGTFLWHSDYGEEIIYKLDPLYGSILESFSFGRITGLTWDGNYLWGSSATIQMIYQIDVSTGLEVNSFLSPSIHGVGLAYAGEFLWASDYYSSIIYKLNPVDGTVIDSFYGPEAGHKGIAFDGQYLWAGGESNNYIYQIDIEQEGSFDWLSVFPDASNIPPNSTVDVELTFDATDLESGIYEVNLLIYSNDPNQPLIIVPVSLTVTEDNYSYENEVISIKHQLSNYPNPFNPTTTISFSTPEESNVELTIFDIKGQKIKTLVNSNLDDGNHTVIWIGDDDNGKPVSTGVYFYRLKSGKFEQTKKMLLIK